jgi:amidase
MATHPEVVARIDDAAGYLADAGYEVAEVEVPDITATLLWVDLISTEITTLQLEQMRALGSPPFIGAQRASCRLPTSWTLPATRRCRLPARILREWLAFLETWPVVLAPVSVKPTWAFDADLQATRRCGPVRERPALPRRHQRPGPARRDPIGFANGSPSACN